MRLLVEHALSLLPYESVQVTTPQNTRYEGVCADNRRLCGVSILRAGPPSHCVSSKGRKEGVAEMGWGLEPLVRSRASEWKG